jgi:hypothetical protein
VIAVYIVPDNPPDPEAAALGLIVRLPAQLMYTELIGWRTSFQPQSGCHHFGKRPGHYIVDKFADH